MSTKESRIQYQIVRLTINPETNQILVEVKIGREMLYCDLSICEHLLPRLVLGKITKSNIDDFYRRMCSIVQSFVNEYIHSSRFQRQDQVRVTGIFCQTSLRNNYSLSTPLTFVNAKALQTVEPSASTKIVDIEKTKGSEVDNLIPSKVSTLVSSSLHEITPNDAAFQYLQQELLSLLNVQEQVHARLDKIIQDVNKLRPTVDNVAKRSVHRLQRARVRYIMWKLRIDKYIVDGRSTQPCLPCRLLRNW